MNPKLVEEVARALWEVSMRDAGYQAWAIGKERDRWRFKIEDAQAAIRVCMARAAEIAESMDAGHDSEGIPDNTCGDAADAIKREGGVT